MTKIDCTSCLESKDIEQTVCICHECIQQSKNNPRTVLKNG
jgi:hypothetical protein